MEVTLEQRIDLEKQIVRKICEDAIAQGFHCRVFDGEEWATRFTDNIDTLMEAIMSTDEDQICFYQPSLKAAGKWHRVGSVSLIYGNSAYEVMADNTVNDVTTTILAGAEQLADEIEAKYYS